MFLFILLIILVAIIGAVISEKAKAKKEENENLGRMQKRNEIFEQNCIKYNIPKDSLTVNYKHGFADIPSGKHFIWINNNLLQIFPAQPQYDENGYILYEIPLNNIEYFATRGAVTKETKITGGGGVGGGTSIAGAVVGGVIAGPAGAIIGSRKKTKIEPIKSEIITHDNRETFLNFFTNGEKHSLFFSYSSYNTLLKLIPNKSYENFVKLSSSSPNTQESIVEQIKGLADLRDKGIITEEEFNMKKKQLLGI